MIVEIRGDGSVALIEAEDMRAFKLVAAESLGDADLARALADVADLTPGHAWVRQSWILGNTPLAASAEWRASFAKMVDYARGKGWLSENDEAIRAHIERR